jgi:hypothetical protein
MTLLHAAALPASQPKCLPHLATVQVEQWLDDAYCITPLSSCFSGYLAPVNTPPTPPPSVSTCLPPNTTTTICLMSGCVAACPCAAGLLSTWNYVDAPSHGLSMALG